MRIDQIYYKSPHGEEIGPVHLNQDLSVIIGDNAAGKTRTINLLFNIAIMHKQPKPRFLGQHSIIFYDDDKKYKYDFVISNSAGKTIVVQDSIRMTSPKETVFFDRSEGVLFNEVSRENEKYSPLEDELSINYVKDTQKHATLLKIKEHLSQFKKLDYSLGVSFQFAILKSPDVLMSEPDGTLLDAAISNISKNYPDKFATINQHFRTMFPTVESITIGPHLLNPQVVFETILIKESFLKNPYPFFEASSGMIKALALLSILFSPLDASCVLIDELENSLDHKRLSALADIIKGASTGKQILITTHSPVLANLFGLEHWIIVRRHDTRTKFYRVKIDEHLKSLIKMNVENYSLYVQDLMNVDEHR